MLGRTPDEINAIRPLKDGVIADFEVTEDLLRDFVHRCRSTSSWCGRASSSACRRDHRGGEARGRGFRDARRARAKSLLVPSRSPRRSA
jgi:hypothetical protein